MPAISPSKQSSVCYSRRWRYVSVKSKSNQNRIIDVVSAFYTTKPRWRWIWRCLPRPTENSAQFRARYWCRHQNTEAGLIGESALRFPHRSIDNGPIRSSECDLFARRCDTIESSHDHYGVHGEWQLRHIFKGEWRQLCTIWTSYPPLICTFILQIHMRKSIKIFHFHLDR